MNGAPQQVAGVDGQALKFGGGFVSVPSAPTLQFTEARFSIAAWVNPYELNAGQQKMADGNWIMSGISARGDAPAGGQHPAAVAIRRGDDFAHWDLVIIPAAPDLGGIWGESARAANSGTTTAPNSR